MKLKRTVSALLATAILCIGLVSCDRRHDEKKDSSTSSITREEIIDPTVTSAVNTTTETENEEETLTEITIKPTSVTPSQQAAVVTPTGVTTTAPSATAPSVAPTTAPPTTAISTTVPVVTTTAPETTVPVTEAETTTQPPTTERPTNIITDSEDLDSGQTVISAVNRARIAEGLGELTYSAELSVAANKRAKEIASNFSHIRPDGSLWYTVGTGIMGENIAKGHNTAAEVVNAWMANEGHRKNILTKAYTKTGVGCYYDSATDTYFWVQLFG